MAKCNLKVKKNCAFYGENINDQRNQKCALEFFYWMILHNWEGQLRFNSDKMRIINIIWSRRLPTDPKYLNQILKMLLWLSTKIKQIYIFKLAGLHFHHLNIMKMPSFIFYTNYNNQ